MTGVAGERILVEAVPGPPVADRRLELVERKGLGHPDAICDALVEAISLALGRMYRERAGVVLHYNIDKALLVAGQCRKGFGGGQVTRPMEFIVGDRATLRLGGDGDTAFPVEETVRAAVDGWVRRHLPHVQLPTQFTTRVVLQPGSAELRRVYEPAVRELAANDTSGASGYAPLTPTEQLVLDVERYLNGPAFKAAFPDTGQDVKVFGLRRDDRLSVTIAMPFLAAHVESEAAYFARKEAVLAALAEHFRGAPLALGWRLNTLDRPGQGADGTYLTLTGTSAEDADSGQVGRGNRANGLIPLVRPAGSEAAPGKNPVAHPGKLYSVLSHRMAHEIATRCPGLREVYVHLATRIGDPVDRPWTGVQVVLAEGVRLGDVEPAIRETVVSELARMSQFRSELLRGAYPVF
jgi:S-adenosylmethionine synthetase